MNVKQNIGIVNALIRITVGLTLLSWSTAKLVKKPWRQSYLVVSILAAMKVAEGIVKYCPVTDLVQSQMNQSNEKDQKPQIKKMIDTFVPKQGDENNHGNSDQPHES